MLGRLTARGADHADTLIPLGYATATLLDGIVAQGQIDAAGYGRDGVGWLRHGHLEKDIMLSLLDQTSWIDDIDRWLPSILVRRLDHLTLAIR